MNLSTNIHNVVSIKTQALCLNGQWHRKIAIRCADDSEIVLALYTDSRPALHELPDEHCRIEKIDPRIETSPVPFDAACSAGEPR